MEKKCPICKKKYTTFDAKSKYCSDACRMRAFQARVMTARRMGDVSAAPRAS